MLTERMDAATAGFEVGCESPSQFSREHSRMPGAPPPSGHQQTAPRARRRVDGTAARLLPGAWDADLVSGEDAGTWRNAG